MPNSVRPDSPLARLDEAHPRPPRVGATPTEPPPVSAEPLGERPRDSRAQAELREHLGLPPESIVRFELDEVTGQTVVKVLDPHSKEVLRQLPAEEVFEAARTLASLQGRLIDLKV